MKKLNDSFEKKWKSLFQDAEAIPSSSAWDRIDAHLAANELARYKKKLFYYKITAAASIALALLFGSYSVYHVIQNSNSSQIVQELQPEIDNANSNTLISDNTGEGFQDTDTSGDQSIIVTDDQSAITSTDNPRTRLGNPSAVTSRESKLITQDSQSGNFPEEQNKIAQEEKSEITAEQYAILAAYETPSSKPGDATSQGMLTGLEKSFSTTDEMALKDIVYQPDAVFHIPYEEPGRKYYLHKKVNPYEIPYMLPLEEDINADDPKRLWAGLILSSGVFNPNITYNGYNDIVADAAPSPGSVERINIAGADFAEQTNSIMSYKPEKSSYNSDASFSYGIDLGYKFSKKFVVFSGLAYQHNYGSTTVHTYIEPTEANKKYANHAIVIERASPEFGLDTYNELNSEVELNSVFEFVTIPVNVGYYLIDKRFKWIMTAGVSTDFFIKNSINDTQGLFDQVQYKNGDDSPYNSIYFNGKFGTMINYTFLKNYQLSLEPSYRLGLSDLTKDNATFNSRPSSFLISAGIAYVFK